MKTSTFLTKVLNKFHNGKSYTATAPAHTSPYEDCAACRFLDGKPYHGRANLIGMMRKVAEETGFPIQTAKFAIARSLGHTSVNEFGTSPNVTFSKVKPVLKAAIKRERAAGN